LKKQNLATQSQLTAANVAFEQERERRLELEKALSPRELPFRTYADRTTNVDDLRKWGPIEVIVEYAQDLESYRTASNLIFLFEKAGWKIAKAGPANGIPADGVTIEPSKPAIRDNESSEESIRRILDEEPSDNLALTVTAWLSLNAWKAKRWSAVRGELAPHQLLVIVGMKPNPYSKDEEAQKSRDTRTMSWLASLAPNANPNKPITVEYLPSLDGTMTFKYDPHK
jgi:hypothetical protein